MPHLILEIIIWILGCAIAYMLVATFIGHHAQRWSGGEWACDRNYHKWRAPRTGEEYRAGDYVCDRCGEGAFI